ncbi:MAG: hypothetical protein STSR0004_13290 [Peptococcaceae bacterium]
MNYQKLKMERKKKMEEEIKRITESFSSMNIKKALLFGSVARNNIRINSDIDLLIIMETELSFLDRLITIYKQLNPQIPLEKN